MGKREKKRKLKVMHLLYQGSLKYRFTGFKNRKIRFEDFEKKKKKSYGKSGFLKKNFFPRNRVSGQKNPVFAENVTPPFDGRSSEKPNMSERGRGK